MTTHSVHVPLCMCMCMQVVGRFQVLVYWCILHVINQSQTFSIEDQLHNARFSMSDTCNSLQTQTRFRFLLLLGLFGTSVRDRQRIFVLYVFSLCDRCKYLGEAMNTK